MEESTHCRKSESKDIVLLWSDFAVGELLVKAELCCLDIFPSLLNGGFRDLDFRDSRNLDGRLPVDAS